jgi:hypothetical protein
VSLAIPALVDELIEILAAREAELRLEQAPHGIDREREVALQTLLAAGLGAGHEVAREVHYPSASGKLSARRRCDLLLDRGAADGGLWLELKIAHQFKEGGLRNPRYGHQWGRAIAADLWKMRADLGIVHAALVLVVFTESRAILDKDLAQLEALLAEGELLAGFGTVRSIEITDRIGHTLCSVAAWPLVSDVVRTAR